MSEQEAAVRAAMQVRYQIVARGEQYGSRYGSQRYDIGAESEELATAEARRAYGKRTGLDNCDITIEVVGLLDADGHDVSRRKPGGNHAAPMLRERLIRACGMAAAAGTQRDRKAYYQEAYAYGGALDVLRRSEDGKAVTDTEGIFQPWAIPKNAWQATAEFLGLNADRLLGEGWMEARREGPTDRRGGA